MEKKTTNKKTNYSTKELTKNDFKDEVVELRTVNPIAVKDIQTKNVPGNMLYKDKNNYYFAPNYSNCIIIRDGSKGKLAKYGIGHYLLDQLSVFAKIPNRPSLVIKSMHIDDLLVGTLGENYQKLEYASDMAKFNKSSSYYYCESYNYFEQITYELYKSRSNGHTGMPPVYIIIEDMTNVDLSHLNNMITISRSRDIHFIVVMDAKDDYKSIGYNFDLRIACENSELKRIIEVIAGMPMLVKEFMEEAPKKVYADVCEYLTNNPDIKLTKKSLEVVKTNCWLNKTNKTTAKAAQKALGKNLPAQLKNWFDLFNGGKLLSTTFLTCEEIKEYNSPEYKKSIKMTNNAVAFASTNYGDFYCFDNEETKGTIYQWDIHEQKAVDKWTNFNAWLKYIIKTETQDKV